MAILPSKADNPEEVGILFLDEATKAHPEVMKGFNKILNEHKLDGLELPQNVTVVLAGNLLSNRSGDNKLPMSVSSRLTRYTFDVDAEEVVDHFLDKNYPSVICSYLMASPESVNIFSPDTPIWPCPRTWERVALSLSYEMERGGSLSVEDIAADVGQAQAKQFWAFMDQVLKLVSWKDILKDPKNAEIPTKMSDQFAVITALISQLDGKENKKNFAPFSIYVRRMPVNRRILFIKLARRRVGKELSDIPEYSKWVVEPEVFSALTDSDQK
jgi:hypothetical protein